MKIDGTKTKRRWLAPAAAFVLSTALVCAGFTGCSSPSQEQTGGGDSATVQEAATRTVTDMAGREVEIPATIDSIATFGSVGVLNAFVECMGEGDKIVNEMPQNFTKNDKWAMQYKFAPQIAEGPVLETADGVDIEATLELAPDLCITMTADTAQQLEENGLACIVLEWGDTEDVKTAVSLMGEVLGVEDRADQYNQYFDDMVAKAAERTASLSDDQRRTVIYGDVTTLTNPHIISEWWIEAAGGVSVTAEEHTKNSLEYTMEDLLAWQPEVIFSSGPAPEDIQADANFASIPAVQNGEIYVVPTVAHVWGNRTVEQPLTVMWAMNKLYPDLYSEAELAEDIKYFYSTFFEYDMSDEEVASIINYQ